MTTQDKADPRWPFTNVGVRWDGETLTSFTETVPFVADDASVWFSVTDAFGPIEVEWTSMGNTNLWGVAPPTTEPGADSGRSGE